MSKKWEPAKAGEMFKAAFSAPPDDRYTLIERLLAVERAARIAAEELRHYDIRIPELTDALEALDDTRSAIAARRKLEAERQALKPWSERERTA